MKIHEYQAKSLLKKYGIPIQDGYIIENIKDAEETISKVKNDFKRNTNTTRNSTKIMYSMYYL